MTEHYHVRAVDMETGESTVEGPFASKPAAVDRAEKWAVEFFSGVDIAWRKTLSGERIEVHAGRTLGGGTRSETLVVVSVERGASHEDVATIE